MPGLLALHAHPDDESLSMGGSLARLAASGEPVTVVTGTRGEVGEIHNRKDADEIRPRFGEVRESELRCALDALGVADLEILGYRDSGMMGTADNQHPDSFWQADFMEAVGRVVRIIRDRRPGTVTAYDPFGGYGHPDHIMVHRVGTAAFFGAPDVGRFPAEDFGEPWVPDSLLWGTWPRDRMRAARRRMAASGDLGAEEAAQEPAAGFLDRYLTLKVDVAAHFDAKWRAVLCHDSQFAADSWVRTTPEEELRQLFSEEVFVRMWGSGGPLG